MSLNLNLPPELEAAIREAAERAGVAPEAIAVAAIQELVRGKPDSTTSRSESSMAGPANPGIAPATWERYHELIGKRRYDAISDAEYSELLRLAEEVELGNARRLERLLELARLRNAQLQALEQMGLLPEPEE